MNREYSDEEILIIVNAFKKFMKVCIRNSAYNFIKKEKVRKARELPFDEYVIDRVSLSNMDNDAFFCIENNMDIMKEKILDVLNKTEKKVILYSIKGYSNSEIAEKLGTTSDYIKKVKSIGKNKIKKYLGEM